MLHTWQPPNPTLVIPDKGSDFCVLPQNSVLGFGSWLLLSAPPSLVRAGGESCNNSVLENPFPPGFWGRWAAPGGGEQENASCMVGEEFQVFPTREGKGVGRGSEGPGVLQISFQPQIPHMAPGAISDYLLFPLAEAFM